MPDQTQAPPLNTPRAPTTKEVLEGLLGPATRQEDGTYVFAVAGKDVGVAARMLGECDCLVCTTKRAAKAAKPPEPQPAPGAKTITLSADEVDTIRQALRHAHDEAVNLSYRASRLLTRLWP